MYRASISNYWKILGKLEFKEAKFKHAQVHVTKYVGQTTASFCHLDANNIVWYVTFFFFFACAITYRVIGSL